MNIRSGIRMGLDMEYIEQVSTPLKFLKKNSSLDGVMRYFAGRLNNEV